MTLEFDADDIWQVIRSAYSGLDTGMPQSNFAAIQPIYLTLLNTSFDTEWVDPEISCKFTTRNSSQLAFIP